MWRASNRSTRSKARGRIGSGPPRTEPLEGRRLLTASTLTAPVAVAAITPGEAFTIDSTAATGSEVGWDLSLIDHSASTPSAFITNFGDASGGDFIAPTASTPAFTTTGGVNRPQTTTTQPYLYTTFDEGVPLTAGVPERITLWLGTNGSSTLKVSLDDGSATVAPVPFSAPTEFQFVVTSDVSQNVRITATPSTGVQSGLWAIAASQATGTPTSTATLSPTVGRSTLATSVISGSLVRGTVAVAVTNGGAALAHGKETVALFATTTGAIDSASVPLGSVTRTLALQAGASANVPVQVKPVALPAGTYTLLARVTDASGNATASTTGPTVVVAPANVALAGVIGNVSPVRVVPGKVLTLSLTITNNGNLKAAGKATFAIYLTVDGSTLTAPAATVTKSVTIKPGKAIVVPQLKVKLSRAATAGSFVPVVVFAQVSATFTAVADTRVTVS